MKDLRNEIASIREKVEDLGKQGVTIESQVQDLRQDVSGLQQEVRQDVRALQHVWLGNGRTGLRLRIDRLERLYKQRRRHFWMLWGAIAAALANGVIAWLVR
jgi:predicted RNase H-like nuclease (RuvC/YqgF family)